jgi:tRNA threonylcarbamoyl adenosine modification protein (Sua5/YciO/YrdC/YwlC family)
MCAPIRSRGDVTEYISIHPETPQPRLVHEAVEVLRSGGVVVYPTDTTYAIGCHIGDKAASDRIRRIRNKDAKHNFALMCRDLSDSSTYAKYSTPVYRLLKSHTPGPYTFLLPATREVPRRLQHPKRKTIGLRVPDYSILQLILSDLGEPLLTSSLRMPGDDLPLNDFREIRDRLDDKVDLIIDAGPCGLDPTSLIRFEDDLPEVVRVGKGDVRDFE